MPFPEVMHLQLLLKIDTALPKNPKEEDLEMRTLPKGPKMLRTLGFSGSAMAQACIFYILLVVLVLFDKNRSSYLIQTLALKSFFLSNFLLQPQYHKPSHTPPPPPPKQQISGEGGQDIRYKLKGCYAKGEDL